jgi:FtsZ-binding cell division protein ZapB
MISEFNDLSDKIDRLAELTQSLRRENATLRQSNALLAAENEAFMERLSEAQRRVEALLATIPDESAEADDDVDAPADVALTNNEADQ